jgi:hypothetical protein
MALCAVCEGIRTACRAADSTVVCALRSAIDLTLRVSGVFAEHLPEQARQPGAPRDRCRRRMRASDRGLGGNYVPFDKPLHRPVATGGLQPEEQGPR